MYYELTLGPVVCLAGRRPGRLQVCWPSIHHWERNENTVYGGRLLRVLFLHLPTVDLLLRTHAS